MSNTDHGSYEPPTAPRPRHIREPLVTPLDVAAYAVALIMVCMPLALGAFAH